MIEAIAAGFIVSMVTTFLIMPGIIRTMKTHGMTGPDMNKPEKPEIAEMGGVGVLIGLFAGIFTAVGIMKFVTHEPLADSRLLLASMIAILGAALVGALDDLFELRQRIKAILPAFFAVPMAYYLVLEPVNLPWAGAIFLGYWMLLIVPFMMTAAANAANMLEGFNGLGTGLGIIMGVSIMIMCALRGNLEGLIIVLPLIGALTAFLYFNYYPAQVFPGDTMMLMMGAALAAGAIMGGIQEAAIVLFVPMIAEFFIKMRGTFHARNHGFPDSAGVLHYDKRVESLTHVVMKALRVKETSFVLVFWAAEIVISVAIIAAFVRM
jgi:UDP-N-acetylglucosamine--dolichyl-phosphate N-acetylglucosaminephosphotransferase